VVYRSGVAAARSANREVYIDTFRGLMALVMVQGHLCDALLRPEIRAQALYQFQTIFHGSTAPGFLFASGFVAGLPRAPLSARAAVRRARRLCFVLGVGYLLHLPYFSLAKTLNASPSEKAALFACDALQVIAVTQLAVIALQAAAGARWTLWAGALAVGIVAAGPSVWAAQISARLPPFFGAYLDNRSGSIFPVFPYAAFVLAGTVAGAALGRQDPRVRHRRALLFGIGMLTAGTALAFLLEGHVDYWSISPAYVLVRLGGLLLLLRAVEALVSHGMPGTEALALFGRETLLVFVLHLYFLFGGIAGTAPLGRFVGRLGLLQATATLLPMVVVLLAAAWLWRSAKHRLPHEASLLLTFVSVAFVYEFLTRPW
jgi:fucose 4-O-acetylase-like acetyltransferase